MAEGALRRPKMDGTYFVAALVDLLGGVMNKFLPKSALFIRERWQNKHLLQNSDKVTNS